MHKEIQEGDLVHVYPSLDAGYRAPYSGVVYKVCRDLNSLVQVKDERGTIRWESVASLVRLDLSIERGQ